MRFEWNPAKEATNRQKHGLDFSFAEIVFRDPRALVLFDRVEDGEERWHMIGLVGGHAVLLVVHSYPDPDDENRVRVISLRRATPNERRRYERD